MTTYVNSIAQLTAGQTVIKNDFSFTEIIATNTGQVCNSDTSIPGFSYNTNYNASLNSGLVSETIYNLTHITSTANLPNSATSGTFVDTYSPTAQFGVVTFTPKVQGSIINVFVNFTWAFKASAIISIVSCVFLNATNPAIINLLTAAYVAGSLPQMCSKGAAQITGLTAGTSYTLNLCAYHRNQGGTVTGPWGNNALPSTGGDYVKVIEYVPFSAANVNSVSPAQVTTSVATPVLLTNFYVPTNKSLSISGNWFALDFTNGTSGNGGDFMFIAQRGSGDVSLSGNNVIQNTILTLGTAPYVFFSVVAGSGNIQMYAVGTGTSTFQFTTSFTSN